MRDRTYHVISAERLREVIKYDPDTGEFRWRIATGARCKAGTVAGCVDKKYGYRLISIDGIMYRGCRLAWLYMKGVWPEKQIDHINRVRSDDRWENLREATSSEQKMNRKVRENTTGFRGVTLHKPSGLYNARIMAGRIGHSLGYFKTAAEASAAYEAARKEYHGEFSSAES